jgi:hypothetical protein
MLVKEIAFSYNLCPDKTRRENIDMVLWVYILVGIFAGSLLIPSEPPVLARSALYSRICSVLAVGPIVVYYNQRPSDHGGDIKTIIPAEKYSTALVPVVCYPYYF